MHGTRQILQSHGFEICCIVRHVKGFLNCILMKEMPLKDRV